jgi:hypothetical protein
MPPARGSVAPTGGGGGRRTRRPSPPCSGRSAPQDPFCPLPCEGPESYPQAVGYPQAARHDVGSLSESGRRRPGPWSASTPCQAVIRHVLLQPYPGPCAAHALAVRAVASGEARSALRLSCPVGTRAASAAAARCPPFRADRAARSGRQPARAPLVRPTPGTRREPRRGVSGVRGVSRPRRRPGPCFGRRIVAASRTVTNNSPPSATGRRGRARTREDRGHRCRRHAASRRQGGRAGSVTGHRHRSHGRRRADARIRGPERGHRQCGLL